MTQPQYNSTNVFGEFSQVLNTLLSASAIPSHQEPYQTLDLESSRLEFQLAAPEKEFFDDFEIISSVHL